MIQKIAGNESSEVARGQIIYSFTGHSKGFGFYLKHHRKTLEGLHGGRIWILKESFLILLLFGKWVWDEVGQDLNKVSHRNLLQNSRQEIMVNWGGSSEAVGKWCFAIYYFKTEPTGFPYEFNVEFKRMRGVMDDSMVLALTSLMSGNAISWGALEEKQFGYRRKECVECVLDMRRLGCPLLIPQELLHR